MPPYEKPKTAYDFITKPPEPQKPTSTLQQKLPLIAGGGIALLVVLFIVLNVLNSGPSNKDTLLKIVQQQTEIARIATLGTKDADQATKNIAYNVSFSLSSDTVKLKQVLAKNDVTFKEKQITAASDPRIDQQLKTARTASNFDETFLKTLDTGLATYQATLKEAHKSSKSPEIRKNLETASAHSATLRKQIKAAQ